jgi:formylglycine-generating enzyme required for sulfatase activity
MALRDGIPFNPAHQGWILEGLLAAMAVNHSGHPTSPDQRGTPAFTGETFKVLAQICQFAPEHRPHVRSLLEQAWQSQSLDRALAALHLRVRLLGWPKESAEDHERLAHELRQRLASGTGAKEGLPLFCRAGDLLAEAGPDIVSGHPEGKSCVEFVRNRLQELIVDPELPAKARASAGIALGHLGDLRKGVGLKDRLPGIDCVELPAGKFKLGETGNEVTVQQFKLSRYPITWKQYQAFVEDKGYEQEHLWKDGEDAPGMHQWWEGNGKRGPANYDPVFQTPNHPRVGVCWYEATAFCRWLAEKLNQEIRLPHENEWEWAARWKKGTDEVYSLKERPYPWGGPRRGENEEEHLSRHCNWQGTGLGHTSAVGLFPDGAAECGALDMAGNVWEWCENEYSKDSGMRVLRGGSWDDDGRASLSCAYRLHYHPAYRYDDFGFRCVWAWASAR